MVSSGTFRQDLYFRLSVIHIEIPPLRERLEDIPLFVEEFMRELRVPRFPDVVPTAAADALERLRHYAWPGNVRELKNVVERSVAMADAPLLGAVDFLFDGYRGRSSMMQTTQPEFPSLLVAPGATPPLPPTTGVPTAIPHSAPPGTITLSPEELDQPFKEAKQRVVDLFEVEYLRALMESQNGNISQGARVSGLTRFHLRELLKKHDLAVSRGLDD
jgi:DNA-binding NtrC family response regulator